MPYVRSFEGFANGIGLLPEQVWDGADISHLGLIFGRPTGAAMPLMWAHAEYIKLLRSTRDGTVFDRIGPVADRYQTPARRNGLMEVWKPSRRATTVRRGGTLRVIAPARFTLFSSEDGWASQERREAAPTGIGIWHVDLDVRPDGPGALDFAFEGIDGDWARFGHTVRVID